MTDHSYLNQEIEALATQDNPFSFTINGQDEEENALTYFFEGLRLETWLFKVIR